MAWDAGRIFYDSTTGCLIWRVEDFFSYPQDRDGYHIASHRFTAPGGQWRLFVYPSHNVAGASRTRLSLWKLSLYPGMPNDTHFQYGIRGRDGAELITYSGEADTYKETAFVGDFDLPADWRRDREKFVPGGVLSVFCRTQKRGETPGNDTSSQPEDLGQVSQDSVDGPSKSCNSPGPLKVLENLKELLSNEDACDVTLRVRNQEFKAHKALLVARSSVFKKIFCPEMSERLSKEVRITNCDPDAFRIFLKHVYTGEVEGLSGTNVFDVFSVAEKYDAPDLKIQCKDYIASNITVETVCNVISFSLLQKDSVLLEKSSEFFTKNFSQITPTNGWQCFFQEHTTTANELLIRALKLNGPPQ